MNNKYNVNELLQHNHKQFLLTIYQLETVSLIFLEYHKMHINI